LLNEIFISDCW